MKQIQAQARSIEALLSKQSYQIDYYQREYRWEEKQVDELVDDLVTAFLDDFQDGHPTAQVAQYGNYFLGPIIVSQRGTDSYIVDGQQRLTTLTLLLIYLENIRSEVGSGPNLRDLIYYDSFGTKTFNIRVDEREPALRQLLDGNIPEIVDNMSESVFNIIERYQDIADRFPYRQTNGDADSIPGNREINDKSLPHFLYWITSKVFLVEIIAASDDDAYTIFETMNDRGLSLTPTDMLKGYLLANIPDEQRRIKANDAWRHVVASLHEDDREASADFFKSWLRSQHGRTIRTGSVGKIQDFDFDRIGSEFHRWVRDESSHLGLNEGADFASFTDTRMPFFAKLYQIIGNASEKTLPGLEHVRYNASRSFTLQPMLLMAPVRLGDHQDVILKKIRLVSMYLDIVLARREWNQRVITQRAMRVAMFNQMKLFRDSTEPEQLANTLYQMLQDPDEDFDTNDRLALNKTNGTMIKRTLARLTEYVARGAGQAITYDTLMSPAFSSRFDIEHIWANHYTRHHDEFAHQSDFSEYRNRIGGLLLLPRSFNSSYGDKVYPAKLEHYFGQNALARSLHPNAYVHHPEFADFRKQTGLEFRSHVEFKKADLDARQELYREIAKHIWNPQRLLDEVEA
jgi:uncharacterized protein with ParB-like and HNH nuclease domain